MGSSPTSETNYKTRMGDYEIDSFGRTNSSFRSIKTRRYNHLELVVGIGSAMDSGSYLPIASYLSVYQWLVRLLKLFTIIKIII